MPEVPAGAKKPSDHKKAKAEATPEPIVVEHNGSTYTVQPEAINDVELWEDIADLESDSFLLPRVTKRFLGAEQWSAFKEANRGEDGVVRTEPLGDLFELLQDAVGNREGSSPS